MMNADMDKQAKKKMLEELKRVMNEMMFEEGESDAMPVAAEVSVMKAEPVEGEEVDELKEAMAPDTDMSSDYEDEDEVEIDLSDPETLAKFKEFLKAKKEM